MNNQICYNIWKVFYLVKAFAFVLYVIPAIIIKNLIGVIAAIFGVIPLVDLLVLTLLTIVWFVLLVPLFIFAGLSKIPGVGFIFAAIGIPVAVLINMIFDCLPSFARLRDPSDIDARAYWRKSIIIESYPFCIEFSQMDTQDPKSPQFYKILDFFKTQYPLNLFLTEFSTDKKEVVDSSPEKEEVTESGKITDKKEVVGSSPEKEEITESGKIKEESLYNFLALLKKGDDEFSNFMAPYVTGYFNNIKIFDEKKISKIFWCFEKYFSYVIVSARQHDETKSKLMLEEAVLFADAFLRTELILSDSDRKKLANFLHKKCNLVTAIIVEFFIGVNEGDQLFMSLVRSKKSEKPKTFSECVCKILADNWLKDTNNTSTQISKNENNEKLKYKNKTVDDFHFFPNPDFALTGSRSKPEEVRQMTNAIEGMQHKAKEQKDEEQFDLFVAAALGLILAVVAFLVIGFTAY